MRKAVIPVLIVGLMTFGAPVGLFAQAAQQGSIGGEALDAGGRPLAYVAVELLQAVAGQPVGSVLQTTVTDSSGAWNFANVEAGDYVVRIIVSGEIAGLSVSLGPGAGLSSLVIVAPSTATASPAFLAALGPGLGAVVVAGIVGAVVATVLIVTKDDASPPR